MSDSSDSATQPTKPELPAFPDAEMNNPYSSDIEKIERLIKYIGEEELGGYLEKVKEYIESKAPAAEEPAPSTPAAPATTSTPARPRRGAPPILLPPGLQGAPPLGAQAGGKKKQRKTKKKGGADIDYSKVYNVQGLIENISKSTGKDPITSQSVPAPFSTGSPLQRLGKKEAKSLPNELKNEIIPDYSQDGGKKKKTDKKKMPKKK